jgi:hypothetical protein
MVGVLRQGRLLTIRSQLGLLTIKGRRRRYDGRGSIGAVGGELSQGDGGERGERAERRLGGWARPTRGSSADEGVRPTMIAREVWMDGRNSGGCCDCETGFASEFQFFVGGDAPFFAVHHGESSFVLRTTARLEWARTRGRVFGGREKAVSDEEDGR